MKFKEHHSEASMQVYNNEVDLEVFEVALLRGRMLNLKKAQSYGVVESRFCFTSDSQ
jgi:hypothetical protein